MVPCHQILFPGRGDHRPAGSSLWEGYALSAPCTINSLVLGIYSHRNQAVNEIYSPCKFSKVYLTCIVLEAWFHGTILISYLPLEFFEYQCFSLTELQIYKVCDIKIVVSEIIFPILPVADGLCQGRRSQEQGVYLYLHLYLHLFIWIFRISTQDSRNKCTQVHILPHIFLFFLSNDSLWAEWERYSWITINPTITWKKTLIPQSVMLLRDPITPEARGLTATGYFIRSM